ncbi:DUF397 domain-containing protein [Streptomyces sp. NPDC093510]|uniref:DUF397 domain-containing protein n=1 Tax=Streptomyces sp. NPDC093510 TaxID=3155199 RepID=UPI00342783F8
MSDSTGLEWFKFSYSYSYSYSEGGNCREMAPARTIIHTRDSKAPGRGCLTVTPTAWSVFRSPSGGAAPEGG